MLILNCLAAFMVIFSMVIFHVIFLQYLIFTVIIFVLFWCFLLLSLLMFKFLLSFIITTPSHFYISRKHISLALMLCSGCAQSKISNLQIQYCTLCCSQCPWRGQSWEWPPRGWPAPPWSPPRPRWCSRTSWGPESCCFYDQTISVE